MKTEEEYKAEVLQLMRDLYPTLKGEEKERAERLFPELKESEDERMRKYILEICIETIKAGGKGLELSMGTTKRLAAWLEKQCEQKPAWSENDEYCRHQLIVFCEHCMVQDSSAKRCAHWLKSLKDKYTWKPSEQDILLLERIADGKSTPQDFQASLGGLIGELKKLKG